MKKVPKYLYVISTTDEYELPLFVADSVAELSKMSGVQPNTISQSICQKRPGYHKIPWEDLD